MPEQKIQLIEKLTGVYASKKSYYAELKEKISEITKRNSQLEILNDLARQISINTPLDQLIINISARVKQIIPFDRVSLCTFRDGKLYLNCHYPKDEIYYARRYYQKEEIYYTGMEIPPDAGRAMWYASNNTQQLVWEQGSDMEDLHLERLGLRVAVISPMCAQERVLGLFVVAGLQEINYDPADLTFLQQLANQLTIYLQDRELFAEVTRAKIEWENTFKAVKDLILVVDRETQILRVNLATLQHSGLAEEAIIGRKCCEVICSSPVPCNHCAVCEALRTGETASSQRQFDDGRVMEFYAYPSKTEQSEPGVVICVRDITERLKMQAQLLKTARLAALGEMSAGVAHELNTPLAVIIGDIQLLLRDLPEDSQKQGLTEDIKTCALRCKQIVHGLLTFSRQEQYVFYPIVLKDVVQEAMKLVAYQIETDNIKIDIDCADELPQIEGNAQQLEQVLVNLLLNAKQSFEGIGGRRLIGLQTGFDHDRNQVFVKVSDTGQGIRRENLTQIFDPFFTSKGVGRGTGLGLSVSLGIIQSHGGTIGVESDPGNGSTFTVYLPPIETCDVGSEE
jgi:two-component system NtrC family sensor kinase